MLKWMTGVDFINPKLAVTDDERSLTVQLLLPSNFKY
jgi:hypothetical protein